MNEVDANRSTTELVRLRELAKQLGFRDEVAHWQRCIDERAGAR